MIQKTADALNAILTSPRTNRFFQAVAIVSLGIALFVGYRQYSLTTCLADYNDATARNTAARAMLAENDRQAQREIFNSFSEALNGPPAETATKIRVALARWQAQQEASDRQRQQNPIPPPPSTSCG